MCGPSIMFRNGTPVLLTASCPLGQKLVCSCAMTLELTDPTARGPFHVMLLPFCGDLWGYAAADLSIAQLLLVCPQQLLILSGSSLRQRARPGMKHQEHMNVLHGAGSGLSPSASPLESIYTLGASGRGADCRWPHASGDPVHPSVCGS